MKKILIAGIPGTGKTTLGNYLKEQHHYEHIDIEKNDTGNLLLCKTDDFLRRLRVKDSDIVITWGFQPYWHVKFVKLLINEGFKLIWLDGDRTVAFDKFAERGTVDQQAFFNQLNNISSSKEDGSFRDIQEIAMEIIK